jgi:hypothetical protein
MECQHCRGTDFYLLYNMEEDKEKKHPVDKTVTPEPPQDMDPSKAPTSEKKAKQPSKDRAGKSRNKNEKRGNEEPKRKLLGESETEITDETTI